MIRSMVRSTLTNGRWYKSMRAGGPPIFSSDYELITTQILGSNTPSVTFSNLNTYSSTYRHLQLRIVARIANVDPAGQMGLRMNGSSSSSVYTSHRVLGTGSTVTQEGIGTGPIDMITPILRTFGGGAGANLFAPSVVDIIDAYSTSKNKVVRSFFGGPDVTQVAVHSGMFISTDPISSLTIVDQTAFNLTAGSRFSLYGIKG